jgi:hypothetical protein
LSAQIARFERGDESVEHGGFAAIRLLEPSVAVAFVLAVVARRDEHRLCGDTRSARHGGSMGGETSLRFALAAAHPAAARERTETMELERAADEASFRGAVLYRPDRRCGCDGHKGSG